MDGLVAWIEKYFLPIATKIGNEKHLVAVRDAFISMMPVTMAGSIAVLLNAFLRDFPTKYLGGAENWVTTTFAPVIAVNGIIWTGTIAIMSLIFAASLGYHLAKAYKVNEVAGAFISLAAFVMGIPQTASTSLALTEELPAAVAEMITASGGTVTNADGVSSIGASAWGYFGFGQYFGGTGLFAAMIFGFISILVYAFLMRKNIIIKLPSSVPPAVSRAFAAIIPGTLALYVCGTIYSVFQNVVGMNIIDWISQSIQAPLMELSQGYLAVLLITVLVHVLWVFGLHGTNIMGAVLSSIYGVAMTTNINAFEKGLEIPYKWAAGSFDAFVWPGGAGVTLALLIALFIFSKRSDHRAVAKLGIAPGLFNINEPVMFGLPVVLNPIFMIPFILAPVATATISYFATVNGLVDPVVTSVLWVMPPVLSGFLSTAGDWRAIILSIINIVVGIIIWAPFVIAANQAAAVEDNQEVVNPEATI